MKTFLTAITLLSIFGSNAFANIDAQLAVSTNPYQTLKEYYDNAPRPVTVNDIPWARNAEAYWTCGSYEKTNKLKDRTLVLKWIEKKVLTPAIPAKPGDGPLVPPQPEVPATYSTRVMVDLVYLWTSEVLSNENLFSQAHETFSIKDGAYVGEGDLGTASFKTDDNYVFYKFIAKEKNPDYPLELYGYCWKN